MSTNRTLVELVAAETVSPPKPLDFGEDLTLQGLQSRELGLALLERAQIVRHQRADRAPVFSGTDPRRPIDVLRNRDGDIFHVTHSYTVSQ